MKLTDQQVSVCKGGILEDANLIKPLDKKIPLSSYLCFTEGYSTGASLSSILKQQVYETEMLLNPNKI